MELINKKYSLRAPDAITVHRDMTMKMIEVNKLLGKLLDAVKSVDFTHQNDDAKYNTPFKRQLVPLINEESHYDLWGYSRETSAPRLAQKRYESKMAKNNTPAHSYEPKNKSSPDHRFASLSPRVLPQSSNTERKEPLEFLSSISILSENLSIALKRSKALTDEYKKIDDNLSKLVSFLASKKNRVLMGRYDQVLKESNFHNLITVSRRIHQTDRNCKDKILEMLNELYASLKNEVNKMKNATKDRRDVLISMVRQDRLSVENIHTSPKKEFIL